MTTLSTHVLDTAAGKPAAGFTVSLHQGDAVLFEGKTDADGRCRDLPAIAPGLYALRFEAGDHFRRAGLITSEPPFLDVIEIRFGVSEADGHYHVPLIVSPFSYSTYRGS